MLQKRGGTIRWNNEVVCLHLAGLLFSILIHIRSISCWMMYVAEQHELEQYYYSLLPKLSGEKFMTS